MKNKKRKIKSRKIIVKELAVIRRRFMIVVLLFIALILISIIGKTIATEETIEPISENVSMVKSSDNIWVPVPKGYSASRIPEETSVNGGFVIYEGENIDWSFLENSEISLNLENEIQETIAESAVKRTYMSSELLGEKEDIQDTKQIEDEANNTDKEEKNIETEDTINDNNLENNDLLENPKDNENDIILKEDEKEVQDENQILNTKENELNSINSNATEQEVILEEEETPKPPTQLEKDIFNLQCSRNQYVWIPVENVSDLYGVDEAGKLWGKLYSYDRDNTKQVINWNWTTEIKNNRTIMNIINKSGNREPDIIKDRDYESYLLKSSLKGITQYEFLQKELEHFFYTTIESIKKYGGFYIGRYETGGLSSNESAVVRKMDTNISSSVNWYKMYEKCKTLSLGNSSITTSMIWGTLWDATLDWFVKTSDDTANMQYSIYVNSNSFANYPYTTFYYYNDSNMTIVKKEVNSNTIIPAGSTDYTKIKNIYDMAGNVFDWTLESENTTNRVCRGGSYNLDINFSWYALDYRDYSWTDWR